MEGKADAAGNRAGVCTVPKRFGVERQAEAFRPRESVLGGATRQYNQKLFSTVAADCIVTSDSRFHAARGFPQHRITNKVTMGIIDLLEMIEVYHKDRDTLLFSIGAHQL